MLEDMPGVSKLHWVTGVQTLPVSKAIVTVPGNAKLVVGHDALALAAMLGGSDPTLEAELRLTHYGTIQFQYCKCGYVVADNWECVNADDVLASLTRWYAQIRLGNVAGWKSAPHFDRERMTITYILRLQSDNGPDVYEGNALVFGRHGFETLVVGTRKGDFPTTQSALQQALAAFRFADGQTYGDRLPDDRISRNHIAAAFAEKAGADDLVDSYSGACRAMPAPQISS